VLSLQRCRELLGEECPYDDAELEELREQCYEIARVVVDTRPQAVAPHTEPVFDKLPPGERVEVEERAAVMEFDGGLGRDHAERAALARYLHTKLRVN
jgi:hypothetical protein